MKIALACLCVVLMPTLALAQGPNVKNPYKVTFCWDKMESDGTTTATGPIQVLVTIDTTAQPLVALPSATGAAGSGGCAAGNFPYLLSGFTSSKGPHSVKVALVSPDGTGTASTPFAFAVVGQPPSTPSAVSVTQ